MKFLETRIIPPIVTLIFGGLMWWLYSVLPPVDYLDGFEGIASKLFLGLGLLILFVAAFHFIKAKTTLNPMTPSNTSSLVITGLYRFSRNPIYVADLFFLIGWLFYLGNLQVFFILILFTMYMNQFQIKPEERALEEKFGDEYRAYKAKVRRWVWPIK